MFDIQYHEGYFAAGNDIPFDENASESWKEGYRDGLTTLYGCEEQEEMLKEIIGDVNM